MRLSTITESTIRYWKWIKSDQPSIKGIPGFCFLTHSDAIKYSNEFDGWTSGPHVKQLYSFVGKEPAPFPIMFGGILSHSEHRTNPTILSNDEVKKAMDYFGSLPEDFFINGHNGKAPSIDEVKLFFSLAHTVGCLKPKLKQTYKYVYDVEVYYGLPAMMLVSDAAAGEGFEPSVP